MTIDEKVKEENLVEVDKKEVMSGMYQSLKQYNKEIQLRIDVKSKVLNFLNEAQTYETIGFKVKYFYDEKTKGYTFSYEEKGV
jgi:hypothetical protein